MLAVGYTSEWHPPVMAPQPFSAAFAGAGVGEGLFPLSPSPFSPSFFSVFLGGYMSSCLRNALKMRLTELFPNSPQFTFSAFSLGCRAFVVIFINSNRWLLPFLPGENAIFRWSWLPSSNRPAMGLGGTSGWGDLSSCPGPIFAPASHDQAPHLPCLSSVFCASDLP